MTSNLDVEIGAEGGVLSLVRREGGKRAEYLFHRQGPWAMHLEIALGEEPLRAVPLRAAGEGWRFEADEGDFRVELEYVLHADALEIRVSATNTAAQPRACRWLRLVSGVDTHMERYPDWNHKLFPTTLRCEGGHLWGVMGSPDDRWLALASPDAWESFKIFYNAHGHHRIHTIGLDLVNDREPRPWYYAPSRPAFAGGQRRTWRLFVVPLSREEDLGPAVARWAQAPFGEWVDPIGLAGEPLTFDVTAPEAAALEVTGPAQLEIAYEARADGLVRRRYVARIEALRTGQGVDIGCTAAGRTCKVTAMPRRPWEWYVHCASEFARLLRPPVATHVCEAAMPAFSLLAAQRLAPTAGRRETLRAFLEDDLFRVAFSPEGEPLLRPDRIQNSSFAMDQAREFYDITGERAWLERAQFLGDWLLERQGADGGLYTHHGTHYTAVTYPAKSLMDLALAERALASRARGAAAKKAHVARARRLMAAVGRCMEDLLRRGANIETEGEMTFEDGMIACSAFQLAQWARITGDGRFAATAEALMKSHRCLEWRGPDCRTNGGTLRFWESYWAIGWGNCLNTPHGWSAWAGWAWHALYLATGKPLYFRRFRHSLTACLSLIDANSGEVYFCFTPDPTIYPNMGRGQPVPGGGWLMPVRPGTFPEGGGETHEVIRLLSGTALENAYVYFDEGAWHGLNVQLASGAKGTTTLTVTDPRIRRLYVNSSNGAPVKSLRYRLPRGVEKILHPNLK
ncbi:MAG: hypothetical protein NTV86_13415 [Planctomycetota bacterium]|nr:hypothetical protein [Planctomycetota bacterium]